jgi:hypothetical protein
LIAVSVLPLSTLITGTELFPLIATLWPVPSIVRSSEIAGRGEASVIAPLRLNLIVSAPGFAFAARIASRSEPDPLS